MGKKILRILMKIYLKEQLNPKIIGLFFPKYFSVKELYPNMLHLTTYI